MGNFYTNFAVHRAEQSDVLKALSKRSAFVSPSVNGTVVVFDEKSDEQDTDIISTLASDLSVRCDCSVLAVMNHDDDVLWYQLYTSGNLIDEYSSCPGYFSDDEEGDLPSGGNVAALASAFGSTNVADVEHALRAINDEFTFAIERHQALAQALGLPSFVVGGGFAYISDGEFPDSLASDDLVRTPV